ncbi:MAG: alpha/beta fold hydrolase [Marmoricola sp.]
MRREGRAVRRLVVVAVATTVGLVSACSASTPKAASISSAPAVPKPAALTWRECPSGLNLSGLQCASLRVPLDYSKPTGTQITLEVSRREHVPSAGKYLGAILANPGGPGGPGVGMPFVASGVPNGVGDRFDWIGWDPRGVGASRPAIHCNPKYFGTDRPPYAATTDRSYWLKQASGYAKACGRSAGALLQHMTTEDNARDMDMIRQALGQSTISYYGFSWGSYLGQVYMTLFPNRVKRVVLDGVVNPQRIWYQANLDQDVAFERALRMFFGWVASNDIVYHLGSTGSQVYAAYRREAAALTAHPAAGGRLGPDELGDALLNAGYRADGWAEKAAILSRLINRGDASGMLADYLQDNAGAAKENGYAVYNAVQCTDIKWPGLAQTLADNVRVSKAAPFETWANAWFNAPCLSWPAAAHRPVTVRASSALPKILLIAETYDAATPFSGALETRSLFPSSSLIEGVGGTTHAGSLSGVSCTDNAVATYLATGETPSRVSGDKSDLKCPPVPRPQASMQ